MDVLLHHFCWPIIIPHKQKGSGRKQVNLDRLGPKTGAFQIKSKAHPTSPAIGPKRIVPVFGLMKPTYTRVCLLSLTFNCFLSFFSQSEALHSSTVCAPYECRRTGRPPPPSTPHTRSYQQHTYLPTTYTPPPRYIHTTNGYKFAPWPQTAVVCRIRNRGMLDPVSYTHLTLPTTPYV